MKVKELKAFLEATDDDVEVKIQTFTSDGLVSVIALVVKDLEPGVIALEG